MTVPSLQPVQHHSVVEMVKVQLRRLIVNGQLPSGDRLLESDLAEQFKVSRVSVRAALRDLVIEGLVEARPRKGAVITRLSEQVAFEVHQVRAALEGMAARTACRVLTDHELHRLRELAVEMGESWDSRDILRLTEIDIAFHSMICEASPNQRLVNQWAVNNPIHGALMAAMTERHHFDRDSVVELHTTLCAALETRRPDVAEAAVRTHYLGENWDTPPVVEESPPLEVSAG